MVFKKSTNRVLLNKAGSKTTTKLGQQFFAGCNCLVIPWHARSVIATNQTSWKNYLPIYRCSANELRRLVASSYLIMHLKRTFRFKKNKRTSRKEEQTLRYNQKKPLSYSQAFFPATWPSKALIGDNVYVRPDAFLFGWYSTIIWYSNKSETNRKQIGSTKVQSVAFCFPLHSQHAHTLWLNYHVYNQQNSWTNHMLNTKPYR